MTRLYGRAAKAPRAACCQVPHGHWSTATFIAALRHERLTAPLLLDGPMEGAMFLACVQKILAPELRRGDLVICDNLSSHKVQRRARGAWQGCGAELLYLPAYSPGPQPDRTGFFQTQSLPAATRATHLRWPAARHRRSLGFFCPRPLYSLLSPCHYATD